MSNPSDPTPQRKLYHMPPFADEHIAGSRRMILAAAVRTAGRRAIVLGAGRCQEIPLAELTAQFEHVLLIDLDRATVEQGLDAAHLSRAARSKIEIQIADLTGLADTLEDYWQLVIAAASNLQNAIECFATVVEGAELAMPNPFGAESFDLVVASCLITQLTIPAIRRGEEIFSERFAGKIGALQTSPRWLTASESLSHRTEAAFLSGLLELCRPQGRIYFAETLRACLTELAADGSWTTEGYYRMTRSLELSDYLDARFQIEERGRWTWASLVPQPGRTGKWFEVQALTLSVRSA